MILLVLAKFCTSFPRVFLQEIQLVKESRTHQRVIQVCVLCNPIYSIRQQIVFQPKWHLEHDAKIISVQLSDIIAVNHCLHSVRQARMLNVGIYHEAKRILLVSRTKTQAQNIRKVALQILHPQKSTFPNNIPCVFFYKLQHIYLFLFFQLISD